MVIRGTSAGEVDRLITHLRGTDTTASDAAIARLRVVGARAVDRLTTLVMTAGEAPRVRVAALRALEGIDDPRVRTVALTASADADETVACTAVAVLGTWVTHDEGLGVLDTLTALALDTAKPRSVRFAALDAVSQLPRSVVQPLLQQLAAETHGDDLPDDPVAARDWLAAHERVPLSLLHDVIVQMLVREKAEPSARRREDWRVTRGAAHALLARRGSRVALYALREAFDTTQTPLPLDFLTAIATLGDSDCLEPMARAWAAAPTEEWWRARLTDTATDIVNRLRLNSRSAAVRRIRAKYAGFLPG